MDSRIENLTFGVELECYLPNGVSRVEAAERVSQAIGGRPVRCEGYNHRDGNYWKIVSDVSVSGRQNGWEFVSPILKGQSGLDELKIVMDTLTAIGATVDRHCGTHVHIGIGRRMTPDNVDLNFLKRLSKPICCLRPRLIRLCQHHGAQAIAVWSVR